MKNKLLILTIVLLALVRLVLVAPTITHPERFRGVDSSQYVDLADTLLRTGRYQGTLYPFPEINLIRPPVYPLFLATNIFLFRDVKWASLVQVLLTLFTAFMLYRIGLDLGQKKAGIAAVLVYLVNINGAFEALSIMTETLTSLWVLLAFFGLVRHHITQKRAWLVVSGAMLGAGALTRPILFPMLIGWCMLILALETQWKPRLHISRTTIGNILLFALGGMAFIFPWQVRNYLVHGEFTLSPVSRVTVENYMIANVVAEVNGISRNDAVALIDAAPDPAAYRIQFIKEHLPTFFKVQFRGIVNLFISVSYPTWAEYLTGNRPISTGIIQNLKFNAGSLLLVIENNGWLWLGIAALLVSITMYGMGAVTIWRFGTRFRQESIRHMMIIAIITIAYLMFSPLGQGSARFRVPAEPLLAWLAGMMYYRPNRNVVQKDTE